ncbi:Myb-like domain-containing protein [Entamoeba marina]
MEEDHRNIGLNDVGNETVVDFTNMSIRDIYMWTKNALGEISHDQSTEESSEVIMPKRSQSTKPCKSRKWDKKEILKLYTGIMKYGADFGLIELMFESRTRKQIKAKFKAEERVRPKMIEKALNAQHAMDSSLLQETLDLISKQQEYTSEEEIFKPYSLL